MRPIETISGMGKEVTNETDGGGKFNYDMFDIL
jgi:hypothetical protein